MNVRQAIAMAAKYGNVTYDEDALMRTAPTEAQLAAAESRCHEEVRAAFETLRAHYRTRRLAPDPRDDGSGARCAIAQPDGYGPCTRRTGHDGPCAVPLAAPAVTGSLQI